MFYFSILLPQVSEHLQSIFCNCHELQQDKAGDMWQWLLGTEQQPGEQQPEGGLNSPLLLQGEQSPGGELKEHSAQSSFLPLGYPGSLS